MPSPGIRIGDLMVFLAVVTIVGLFLVFVRALIHRVEAPDPPQAPEPDSARESPPSEEITPASDTFESHHSVAGPT